MLVGVNGVAQSGKDSIAEHLIQWHGFKRVGFADALREFMYALNPIVEGPGLYGDWRYQDVFDSLGYEGAKKVPEVRELLQRLGTDAGRRVLGEDIWVDTAVKRLLPGVSYVFTDVRFPNEAAAVRDRGGQVWRVNRPGYGPVNGHPSETALDGYRFDAVIDNDGSLKDLADRVDVLLNLVAQTS